MNDVQTGEEPLRLPWLPRTLASLIHALVTEKTNVPAIGKLARGVLLVPIFGLFLLDARWRTAMRRPIAMIASTCDGLVMRCAPPDLVQMYIALFGVWEPDLAAYIRRSLRHDDVFIDIGANVGYDALLAAKHVGSGSVVAIEASPRMHEELSGNIKRNAFRNVRSVNKAAAATEGEITVFVGPEHNLGLTTTVAQRGFKQEAQVQALPLHRLLTDKEMQRARMVKIDVEGGEPDVLRGMSEFLLHAPSHVEILIELSPLWWADQSQRASALLQPFVDAGFHVYTIANNYWPWRYLWPFDVQPPRRFRGNVDRKVKRIDIVLSRRDVEML